MTGPCEYCGKESPVRVPAAESGVGDLCVCELHWSLLKDPKTALPLIRGDLAMKLRGEMPAKTADVAVSRFMDLISKWK